MPRSTKKPMMPRREKSEGSSQKSEVSQPDARAWLESVGAFDDDPVPELPTDGSEEEPIRVNADRLDGVIALPRNDTQISVLFDALNGVEVVVERVVQAIPSMTDTQLEDTIIYASTMEKAAFVVRGAATAEIQKRVASRMLTGVTDVDGMGVKAEIARMAHRVGRETRTLEGDAQIFRTFGDKLVQESDPLPREMYVAAAAVGDRAQEAIELAHTKRSDPTYTVAKFKADLRQMMDGKSAVELESVHWVSVDLTDDQYEKVKGWSKKWGCSNSQTIKEFIKQRKDVSA